MSQGALKSIICQSDAQKLTVGEKKTLVCSTAGIPLKPDAKISFSYPSDSKNQFEIQFLGDVQNVNNEIRQTFTSYKVGPHDLNQIKLKIDDQELLVSPQHFEVKSVIENLAGKPTPFPIEGPGSVPVPWWWWGIWIALLLGVSGYGLYKYFQIRNRKKNEKQKGPEIKLTPQQSFQAKIRKLESKGLHNRGEYKVFALELTNIVKKTIGEVLHFEAEDLTSEELLSTLERRHKAYFNTAGTSLSQFLSDLDQIKFAKIETNTQKCADLLDRGARIGNALFGRLQ